MSRDSREIKRRAVLIKQSLALRDISQTAIARRLRVTPQAVYRVITGRSVSRRIRAALARAIGMRYKDLWE